MFMSFALIATALLPSAAVTSAQPTLSVVAADGSHFEYRSVLDRNGVVRIFGRSLESGKPFELRVDKKGRVTGEIDRVPVAFSVGKAKRDGVVADITKRYDRSPDLVTAARDAVAPD